MARNDYYEYDDGERRWLKVAVAGIVCAGLLGAGYWVLTSEKEVRSSGLRAATTSTLATGDVTTVAVEGSDSDSDSNTGVTATTTESDEVESEEVEPTGSGDVPGPNATATTVGGVAASTSPTTTTTPPTTTTSATTTSAWADNDLGYPTSEDGAPLPIIVTYDVDVITISGLVPSQAAKDRLGLLVLANSKTEATLVNQLVINENVPIGVGVRVIELNSVRFPEGSAEILPDHAAELERVATVMTALPNLTVVVVGHADQRGTDERNYAVSAERAAAVVNLLRFLGVSPTRMSSRAAGETDLLSLGDDKAALALNRRTEFIFYGLLVE